MSDLVQLHAGLFQCPDDGVSLRFDSDAFCCPTCERVFPLHAETLLEFMPKDLPSIHTENAVEIQYVNRYQEMFHESFAWKPQAIPWGHMSVLSARNRHHVLKQQRLIRHALPDTLGVCCDLSAGSGNYPLLLASRADIMLLCDLSVDNVNYLHGETNRLKLQNMLIMRGDYHRSSIADSTIDTVLCTDTLIYGRTHERALLDVIYRILKPGGTALVNFKNSRHRLPFKKAIMQEYTKADVRAMVREAGFTITRMIGYYQELAELAGRDSVPNKLFKWMFPATRFYALLKK